MFEDVSGVLFKAQLLSRVSPRYLKHSTLSTVSLLNQVGLLVELRAVLYMLEVLINSYFVFCYIQLQVIVHDPLCEVEDKVLIA